MMESPRLLLGLGLILMILGIVIPFLILIRVLESTFFLNFFSRGASIGGLFLGIIGIANWTRNRKE